MLTSDVLLKVTPPNPEPEPEPDPDGDDKPE